MMQTHLIRPSFVAKLTVQLTSVRSSKVFWRSMRSGIVLPPLSPLPSDLPHLPILPSESPPLSPPSIVEVLLYGSLQLSQTSL